MDTHTTRVTRHYDASRSAVYRALVDAEDIARWKVPDGMSIVVHEHEAREGGRLRISLTYDGPVVGKSTGGPTPTTGTTCTWCPTSWSSRSTSSSPTTTPWPFP